MFWDWLKPARARSKWVFKPTDRAPADWRGSGWYTYGKVLFFNGEIDLLRDDLRIALFTDRYAPRLGMDRFLDDIGPEVMGRGYPRGGLPLIGRRLLVNDGLCELRADALTFSKVMVRNVLGNVLYKNTGDRKTSPLLGYFANPGPQRVRGGNYTINFEGPARTGPAVFYF